MGVAALEVSAPSAGGGAVPVADGATDGWAAEATALGVALDGCAVARPAATRDPGVEAGAVCVHSPRRSRSAFAFAFAFAFAVVVAFVSVSACAGGSVSVAGATETEGAETRTGLST